jgi:DNA modification methylase
MIFVGNVLDIIQSIPSESIQTCVTSPPYWGLRDYGVEGQLGLEKTPEEYIENLLKVFRQVHRCLTNDGTLWLNLGDSYYSQPGGNQGKTDKRHNRRYTSTKILDKQVPDLHPKNLVGIPWRVALALQADGWILRQDIIWHKPNTMPESVTDRCTKAHEYIFLLSKSPRYFFDNVAFREPATDKRGPGNKNRVSIPTGQTSFGDSNHVRGSLHKIKPKEFRNRRSVWKVSTKPFKGAHFATFPPDLIEPCILAGSLEGSTVLDPFIGAGTTGLVAKKNNRKYIGIELNPEYAEMATKRIEEMNK